MSSPHIINRPGLQSRLQRITSITLTAFFWVLWLTVWIPVITLIAWAFGLHIFINQMTYIAGLGDFLSELSVYATIIGVLVFLEIAWAKINAFRFRGVDRRNHLEATTKKDIAAFFDIEDGALEIWKHASAIVVDFDEHGNIIDSTKGHLEIAPDNEADASPFGIDTAA